MTAVNRNSAGELLAAQSEYLDSVGDEMTEASKASPAVVRDLRERAEASVIDRAASKYEEDVREELAVLMKSELNEEE